MDIENYKRWEERYQGQAVEAMPWYFEELDPDLLEAIEDQNIEPCKILDLGSGPGTQAIALAKMGFDVTGSDISDTAVAKATESAAQSNGHKSIKFVQDDIQNSRIDEKFDLIFDRGCFHTFPPEQRDNYAQQVAKLLNNNGRLFIKCFSTDEPEGWGPHRISKDEIKKRFSGQFEIVSIRDTYFDGGHLEKPHALFCEIKLNGKN